jgi:hypothetical protein
MGISILKEHGDDFVEVGLKFVKRLRLGMSTR